MQTLSTNCRCGHVKGVLKDASPRGGMNIVCYCDDCQDYARFLGTPDITDRAGGSAIFQAPPAHLTLTEGQEAVKCVRLSAKGMHRWYAGCCNTPIANTQGPKLPFAGVLHAFLRPGLEGHSSDELLGKPMRLMGKLARETPPAGTHPTMPPALLPKIVYVLTSWWLRGKARPNPFFDGDRPRATPEVLDTGARQRLRSSTQQPA